MSMLLTLCYFFFSSRRRHTRLQGDWSSDVCSSDLGGIDAENGGLLVDEPFLHHVDGDLHSGLRGALAVAGLEHVELALFDGELEVRSEERRVGEESRSPWSPDHLKKKKEK